MRDAKVGDYRRHLVAKKDEWETTLSEFSYEEVPGLGSGLITLGYPLVLFTGPNGVGKSTLAKCLFATLVTETQFNLHEARTAQGFLKIIGSSGGKEVEAQRDLGKGQHDIAAELSELEVIYLDCARAALKCQSALAGFEDISEITNGISAIELPAKELAEVSRIVCREYRFVRLYEVESDGTVPFFEVAYGSAVYNSHTMGDGELAALLIWWTFWRAKKGSLIILEEPETFLSALCQKNLAEYLIAKVTAKKLISIVSTHSPNIIDAAPSESIRFFARTDKGVNHVEGEAPPVLLKSIGIVLERKGHLFVEDTAGKAFARSILERFNPSLSRALGITVSKGEAEIKADLERFEALGLDMKSAGIFDGDIDAKNIPAGSTQLPGNQPVEKLFRSCAKDNIERLKDISGIPAIDVIMHSLEGKDHHDWFEDFARELGLDKGQAFNLLFRLWIEQEGNRNAASAAVDRIADLFP